MIKCSECKEELDENVDVLYRLCHDDLCLETDYSAPGTQEDLWHWINEYVRICGGDPDKNVYANVHRQEAVARIENLVYGGWDG